MFHRVAAMIATCALGTVCVAGAHAACAVTDIEIKDWSWSRDAGWFSVVGELVNNCAEPVGAQVQITFRDEAGKVVNIDESWPAGSRNIPARGTYAFKTSSRAYATAKNVAIRVMTVRQWPASGPAR
jgi:hypothetical protein